MDNIKKVKNLNLDDVSVNDSFWTGYINLIKDVVIPYQWEALNDRVEGAQPSHSIKNFRIAAGEETGKFQGYVFQDSDLYKWIEAASYILSAFPDSELDRKLDYVIELIGKAQQPDGYVNTYFTVKEPDKRWTNERDKHELYCAGHLIEAAVAHYEATGKDKLLDIACRFADYIDTVFGREEGKKHGYPGHQVIEMALIKLYHATSNERYLNLGRYFIDERGCEPNFFALEAYERGLRDGMDSLKSEPCYKLFKDGYQYNQSHLPVRSQTKAVGHAVRAVYMYTAMAELAAETGDAELSNACRTLWDDVTGCQMYITGGIGSDEYAESFSFDYDLPNDTVYAETCASVGMVFWANGMFKMEQDGRYGDIIERELYNGTISGISMDGKRFFYVNPLEVWPEACKGRHDKSHVAPVRQKWFGCACCPPNIARLIASMRKYIYALSRDNLYVQLYASSRCKFAVNNIKVELEQQGNYPWDGNIKFKVCTHEPVMFGLSLRIPEWCQGASIKINGRTLDTGSIMNRGYAEIRRVWKEGDCVELSLPMVPEMIQANPNVRADAGKIAIQRGPVVYCIEETDNGKNLQDISIDSASQLNASYDSSLLGGVVAITGRGYRSDMSGWSGKLYRKAQRNIIPVNIKAVPYYAWGNREPGEMAVWIRER